MYDDLGRRFTRKPSDEAKIWQYMDIPKLISILDRKELYFSNTSKFSDPYEGTLAEYNRNYGTRLQKFAHKLQDVDDIVIKRLILASPEASLGLYKDRLLVNCWHLNDGESAAMWDLYSTSKAGIAIQSTFKRLCDSFNEAPEIVHIGMVDYKDYRGQWLEEDFILPFLTKRLSFKHEQELRAFTIIYDNDLSKSEIPENVSLSLATVGKSIMRMKGQPHIRVEGRYIKVNLERLVEKIYVAPLAADYLNNVVKSLLTKYDLSDNLLQVSDLYSLK